MRGRPPSSPAAVKDAVTGGSDADDLFCSSEPEEAGFESDELLYKVVGVDGPAAAHFGVKCEQGSVHQIPNFGHMSRKRWAQFTSKMGTNEGTDPCSSE